MQRTKALAIGLVLLLSTSPRSFLSLDRLEPSSALVQHEKDALQYLVKRFNPVMGLVSESEDRGSNALGFNTVNRTYWIASDNLWAQEVLKERYPEMASKIRDRIAPFLEKYGYPNLFEVVLGRPITFEIYDKTNLSVENRTIEGELHSVLYDIHRPEFNQNIFRDAEDYADLDFYIALNHCLHGDRTEAETWFRLGEKMWDGRGFYDKAVRSVGLYQNYKLGLFLFAATALGVSSNVTAQVEEVIWSRQKLNATDGFGGIATLSYLTGKNFGTANVESTSILLMAYKDNSTEMVGSSCRPFSLWLVILLLAFVAVAIAVAVTVIIVRRKRSKSTMVGTDRVFCLPL